MHEKQTNQITVFKIKIFKTLCSVKMNNNNNNDRLTAFDPGQPG